MDTTQIEDWPTHKAWSKLVRQAHKGKPVHSMWKRNYARFMRDMGKPHEGDGLLAVKLIVPHLGYVPGNCLWMRIGHQRPTPVVTVQDVGEISFCRYGHPMLPANVYEWVDKAGRPKAACRLCKAEAKREHLSRKIAVADGGE